PVKGLVAVAADAAGSEPWLRSPQTYVAGKRNVSPQSVTTRPFSTNSALTARCRLGRNAKGSFLMESGNNSPQPRGLRLHPRALRIMHWTNALAMIIMIGSGWKIYNDEVLFGWLHFPDEITIGGEAYGALQWHFLGMWILTFN